MTWPGFNSKVKTKESFQISSFEAWIDGSAVHGKENRGEGVGRDAQPDYEDDKRRPRIES